uniref:Calmodulin n=1 Tax=Eutreptiella gymnastica TaxID=73025 RepID=A0A7S1N9X2_9EUGL|mmetsp:Transcript_143287/g.250114  ORF Transcript_143287/g.250114 Transcript_143287/m.250114 type:complete len:581 (+) Transcript_143287:127-1869(+)
MPPTATKYLYTSDDNEPDYDAAELEQMKEWMVDKGLKKYLPLMIQNEVFSLQDLALLNSADLVEMGMKAVGSRRKLLAHTQHLKTRYDTVNDYAQNGFYAPSFDVRATYPVDSPPKRYHEPSKILPPIRAGSAGTGRPVSAGKRQGSGSIKQRPSTIPGSVDSSEVRDVVTSEAIVQTSPAATQTSTRKTSATDLSKAPLIVDTAKRSNNKSVRSESRCDDEEQSDYSPKSLRAKAEAERERVARELDAADGVIDGLFFGEQVQLSSPTEFMDESDIAEMLAPAIAELEGEKMILESINDSASTLLAYEKEDRPENWTPGKPRHTAAVDIDFFRSRMQGRIDKFLGPSTPPLTARTAAIRWAETEWPRSRQLPKVNYAKLMEEQEAHILEMDKVHYRYQELLDQCLDTMQVDVARHGAVGEFRDLGEYKLKIELGKLIGMVEEGQELPAVPDELPPVPVNSWVVQRRRLVQAQFDALVKSVDLDGNGLLDSEELKKACDADEAFRQEMEVIAFNLALDPDVRHMTDCDELNDKVQSEIEKAINVIDQDGNGLLSREEMDKIEPSLRHKLVSMGLPNIFGV